MSKKKYFELELKIFFKLILDSKFMLFLAITFGLAHSLSSVSITVVSRQLFDNVELLIKNSTTSEPIFKNVIYLALSVLITQIFLSLHNYTFDKLAYKLEGLLRKNVNEWASRFNAIDFEDPSILDTIFKAKKGVDGIVVLFTVIITLISFYIPYFLFMGYYLFNAYKPLTIIIILIFLPVLITQILKVRIFSKLEDQTIKLQRECEIYEKYFYDLKFIKDTIVLKSQLYFKNILEDKIIDLNKFIWKAEKKSGINELIMKLITLFGYVLILIILVVSYLNRNISIGMFVAIFSTTALMITYMDEIINVHIGRLTQNLNGISNYTKLFELVSNPRADVILSFEEDIILSNVYFKYPYSSNFVLKNVNLVIKSGESIAIVGSNGSGKTTLTNIISGLYSPTVGIAKIGNQSMNQLGKKGFNKISEVFQNSQNYRMTVYDNIQISDIEQENLSEVENDLSIANLNIEDKSVFPNGIDTILSREFGGVDISGGQWKKIAIARGLYRNNKLLILDEPTASIDPIEESKLYNLFKKILIKKTAVIITHRIGSAQIADRIIVLHDGEIIEQGTHKELLQKGGEYYLMFKSQANWYIND